MSACVRAEAAGPAESFAWGLRVRDQVLVALLAAVIFAGCIWSPPALMDDVDSVQAQIARNMLQSGDWVTARLDGIAYLEKAPLKYWMIAISYRIFGVHDWAARIPSALFTVILCWVVALFGAWAFGRKAGLFAGLALATSVGLFLFTRILIPDSILTLAITLAVWGFLRAIDEAEPHPTRWAMVLWASMAAGMLLKGLIAVVFPCVAGLLYLALTRQMLLGRTWKRLRLAAGVALFLTIAAPWHVMATLRNPPYFDFTMHSERGSYHGFFWFYFINEHVLRFLNRRYPRDYNTVPRLWFWLFHLLWLFPWSAYLPAAFRLDYRKPDRASRARLMMLCWAGAILVFFSFSTTQEYYSMPCYPALALLLGSAMAGKDRWLPRGTKLLAVVATAAALAIAAILWLVRGVPTPGDISEALRENPDIYAVYTLSLGHMTDLTLRAFAYLRLPLMVAMAALAIGAWGAWRKRVGVPVIALCLMMALFFHAARIAMVTFDPYLSSRPLAEALLSGPPGELIADDQYYTFSSVFFYTNRSGLLLNGRVNNLVYGSYAPGARDSVFIDDAAFARLWGSPQRYYLVAEDRRVPRLKRLAKAWFVVKASGGKVLVTNHELSVSSSQLSVAAVY